MRFKYKIKTVFQFFAFAFYPKTTLVVCAAFTAALVVILGVILSFTKEGTGVYNVLFALVTGAVASFFVTFIVELSGNYRHNKIALQELGDYYHTVAEFEGRKNIHKGRSSHQRAEKLAKMDAGVLDDPEFEDIRSEINKEYHKDDIQATWAELPELIPILLDTLQNKKEFLSDQEIEILESIGMDYDNIRTSVKEILSQPYLYNSLNHPDIDILKSVYPQNIIDDMPDWTKKCIASEMSLKVMDDFTDQVLSDNFLRNESLKDYDISQHGLESYNTEQSDRFEDDITDAELQEAIDEQLEHEASLTEEEFKAEKEYENQRITEEERPFASWFISKMCKSISEEMLALEQIVIHKPFYGLNLSLEKKWSRTPDRKMMNEPGFNMYYNLETKNIEKNGKKCNE